MDAIVTYDLNKQYGKTSALRGMNLIVPEAGTVACIGERGSGKTTLIRLLSGLCRPTSGECSVLGISPYYETGKLHSVVGTVLGTARLYENMTLAENMLFFAGVNGVEENDALERMSLLLHKLGIWEERDEKVDDLPTHVTRRASLARALMHSPRVLLLDLPDVGLNREAAESFRETLSYLVSEEGTTILLCTEDAFYGQTLCDRFAFLKNGSLLAMGDEEYLRRESGLRYRAILRLGEGERPPRGFRPKEGCWVKEIDSGKEMPDIIFSAVGNGNSVFEARVEKPSLEEIYQAWLAGGKRRAGEKDEQDGYAPKDAEEYWSADGADELPDGQEADGDPETAREQQPESIETGDAEE